MYSPQPQIQASFWILSGVKGQSSYYGLPEDYSYKKKELICERKWPFFPFLQMVIQKPQA
jgi:hypothetical protein